MRTPSRSLSALFGVAVLGVLLAGGLLAARGGLPVLLGYLVVVGVLLGIGVARIRRLVAASAPAPRACACCGSDGDHTAPVTVR